MLPFSLLIDNGLLIVRASQLTFIKMRNILLIIACTLLFLFGCKKDKHPVPNRRFNVTIDLMLPDYHVNPFIITRSSLGEMVGVSGVIVYRGGDGNYYAFERYCPHDQDFSCVVSPDPEATVASCSCCGSRFLIASPDGDVLEGPSKYFLKRYNTSVSSSGTYLTIYN